MDESGKEQNKQQIDLQTLQNIYPEEYRKVFGDSSPNEVIGKPDNLTTPSAEFIVNQDTIDQYTKMNDFLEQWISGKLNDDKNYNDRLSILRSMPNKSQLLQVFVTLESKISSNLKNAKGAERRPFEFQQNLLALIKERSGVNNIVKPRKAEDNTGYRPEH